MESEFRIKLANDFKNEEKKLIWFDASYLLCIDRIVSETVTTLTIKDWGKVTKKRYQIEVRLHVFVPDSRPCSESSTILFSYWTETKEMAARMAADLRIKV